MIENQATINDLTLRLDKERAKLDVDQSHAKRELITIMTLQEKKKILH